MVIELVGEMELFPRTDAVRLEHIHNLGSTQKILATIRSIIIILRAPVLVSPAPVYRQFSE